MIGERPDKLLYRAADDLENLIGLGLTQFCASFLRGEWIFATVSPEAIPPRCKTARCHAKTDQDFP